jgi:uncharacterized protein
MASRQPYFEIRRSPIQGKGAFALRRIRAGTRIIEYTGEHISYDESDKRYDDAKMSRHHTFLFILDDKVIIDAAVGGNEARFINHSCDPNCEAIIEGKHIYIYARRNIQPGVELAYDYKYEREDGFKKGDEAFYICKCGAKKCRGTILVPERKRRKKKPARRTKKSARG